MASEDAMLRAADDHAGAPGPQRPALMDAATLAVEDVVPDEEWVARLTAVGQVHDDAVQRLRALMLRAVRHQVSRMPMAAGLGQARRDEVVHTAANEATMAVLNRLDTFEGRSRFTTWAYKFGLLCAGVQVRRSVWRDRDVELHDLPEPVAAFGSSPEAYTEGHALAVAVREAMVRELTPHQRRIALALLVDDVPIDVLAERLGTTRGALYKTLHDARKRLRTHLIAEGFLPSGQIEEVGQ